MMQFATLTRECVMLVDANDQEEAWGALEERIRYLYEEHGVLLPDVGMWVYEGER